MSARSRRSSIRVVMAAVVAVAAVAVAGVAQADPGRGCDRPSTDSSPVATIAGDRHPLVFVHGWIDHGAGMRPTWEAVESRMPNTFEARMFDYRNANSEWAASPRVSGCLADYLSEVSRAHRENGGDGRVYVVAHSMGGLVTRFAADRIDSGIVAGLTTIATPHLGSPFGDTGAAGLWQWKSELANADLAPDRKSDAVRCLAIHHRDRDLPAGCATPPYLPAGVSLGQISGTNVIRRTLFGIPLYDIDLRSDGVVGVDSATGYLPHSGPRGESAPRMSGSYLDDISCTVTSDQTLALLRSFRGGALPASIITAELAAIASFTSDSHLLDQIADGDVGPDLAVLLVIAALTYPCGHNAMTTQSDAMDSVADSLRAQLRVVSEPKKTTLRPFDRKGNLAAGWTLDVRTTGPIDCEFATASPSAVDNDIQLCAPTAAGADSCLLTSVSSALCLIDPFATAVVRNTVSGKASTSATAPASPAPIGIVLDDGTKCRRRNGGSWPVPDAQPDYVGFYGCTTGATFQAVWGARGSQGFTRGPDGWTVEVGGEHGPLRTHRVAEVFYVGVA